MKKRTCLPNKKVNIVIVRLKKDNTFSNSKPCIHCFNRIKRLPQQKGYKVKNIYYSNSQGEIIKTRLNKFTTDHISSGNLYKKT